jgi:ABC-type transport system substrate-binding protein
MKFMQPAIAFFMIVLATATCCGGGGGGNGGGNTNGGGGGGVTTEPEKPIGNISLVRTHVESGRNGNVQEVNGSRDFFNEESVTVRDNGKGKINFNDGSEITLYNKTTTGQVVAQVSPPEISLLLTEQGFQGYVPKGNTFKVNMPNGAKVTILGTHFFVIFDPGNGFTSIGNFDGTVRFTPPGRPEQDLPPATMVDIAPDGTPYFQELRYNPDTFDRIADDAGSLSDGLVVLRKEFGQSIPWEGSPPTMPPSRPTVIRYLVTTDGSNYYPDLATDWGTDPDGYIIQFHLQQGVLLPDGSPFTSTFVRDTLEKNWQYAIDGNVSFEIIDDYTISFHLFSPATGYVLQEMSKFGFEVLQ